MTIVILAAGASRRMGRQKLLLPIDGRPLIVCALEASRGWPRVIVAGDEVAALLAPSEVPIARNAAPERGMSHSLALGNGVVAEGEPIAVLLADLPDISATEIATVIAAYDESVDVVVPVADGRYGHPVVFGPNARALIPALPDGDTIRQLRDDPRLRRRLVETAGLSLTDIDTPDDYIKRGGVPADISKTSP